MKRILLATIFIALTVTASAQGGAGLSTGQAYVAPSANPNPSKKHCPHCGITQGNITYPWQHEVWCPYYRSQGSSGSYYSGTRHTTSTKAVAASIAGYALGSLISEGISALMDPGRGDNNIYHNDSFGGQISFVNNYAPKDDHTCVVLRSNQGARKLGVWHNAYVADAANPGSASHMQVSGFWMVPPEFDQIYLGIYGSNLPYAICGKDVNPKKGEPYREWTVYEFRLGSFNNTAKNALISPTGATDVRFNLSNQLVALQLKDASGNPAWSIGKVERAPKEMIKKHQIYKNEKTGW